MTAVASPPSFANINRPAWGSGGQSLNTAINHDDVRGMFVPRKTIQRTNSSSSISSNSSTSSASTLVSSNGSVNGNTHIGGGAATPVNDLNSGNNGLPITTLRKRPLQKSQWSANKPPDAAPSDYVRGPTGRQQIVSGQSNVSSLHQLPPFIPGQTPSNSASGAMARPADPIPPQGQPVLYLISLNGTFDRKTITVPFIPETLRIGRQTNKSTTPTTVNGYFDSKVLSRQHAEIWADRNGKIWIRDIKSSNGTFINGVRLSAENRESDPHELQTNDNLELGIDIVSEDQKSVVHHKVAARVEHAGYINASTSLLDMSFGDLDPANGAIMGPQINGMPFRSRNGSQSSIGTAGRMAPTSAMATQTNGIPAQRGLWFTGPSTEAIVKKIHQEMRNAKQQSQDLMRTQEFLKTLLSKNDIRNEPKMDVVEPSRRPPMTNGNGMPFRPDARARFTDPPAPPPQQPLPEKPSVASLKRSNSERPKSGSGSASGANTSPVRQDAMGQVLQLTDALNTAKKEIDTQHTRMRELEDKLHREQEARRSAEEMARRLEEASAAAVAAAAASASASVVSSRQHMNGSANGSLNGENALLRETFGEPTDATSLQSREAQDAAFRTRLESMRSEMEGMKQQLDEFRRRAEKAEAERDADRETLAEMVQRIRQRDEEDAKRKASTSASTAASATAAVVSAAAAAAAAAAATATPGSKTQSGSATSRGRNMGNATGNDRSGPTVVSGKFVDGSRSMAKGQWPAGLDDEGVEDSLSLTRSSTLTPSATRTKGHDRVLTQGIPYASMVGVVLVGMGLMAYLNGWQTQPPRLDH